MLLRILKVLLSLLLVAGAAAGGAALSSARLRPRGETPPLRLPAEVRGRPGRLVRIDAETTAAVVRWHACRGPDQPDLWPAPDGKTLLLATPTPGRYELLAWTVANGEATEGVACTVLIDGPAPPPRPPEPSDLFLVALQTAWAAESSPERVRQRDQLASLYRVAASETVRQPQLTTVGELLTALQQAARSLLPGEALPKLRAAIATELRGKLPTNPDTPLDAPARDCCAEQFARVVKALESLR